MAEIRLICPGCAAEYRLSDAAIPPGGREVECSACGKVWHTVAQPAPLAPGPGDDTPQLSRPLPDSVLDILRGEVEHERRARAAEDASPPPPPAPAPAAPPRAADPQLPAPTNTTAITPPADPAPIRHPPSRPKAQPVPSRTAPAQPVQEPASSPTGAETPLPDKPPVVPEQPAPVAAPAPRPARAGYAAGFGLAAMLAASCVALYLLAPQLSDQGAFGAGLMELRAQVDEARMWLQDRAAGPAR